MMWPTEALTVKFFPRYLPMVFALAGDSTMTSDFRRLPLRSLVQGPGLIRARGSRIGSFLQRDGC